MTKHQSEPESDSAFWRRYNFNSLARVLDDLLCWAIHPHPEALSNAWLDKTTNGLRDATNAAMLFVDQDGDASLIEKIKRVESLGIEYATLLCERPALSMVPIEQWTVPKYRRLFDEIDALNAEFHRVAEPFLQMGEVTPPPVGNGPPWIVDSDLRGVDRVLAPKIPAATADNTTPTAVPGRANSDAVQRSTKAAIGHKLRHPEASAKQCAEAAGMPDSTLCRQDDWKKWKGKIERATNTQQQNIKAQWESQNPGFSVDSQGSLTRRHDDC